MLTLCLDTHYIGGPSIVFIQCKTFLDQLNLFAFLKCQLNANFLYGWDGADFKAYLKFTVFMFLPLSTFYPFYPFY